MQVKLRIVGIGNSIMNGFPLKRSECFLSQTRRLTGNEVINKGINGETTADIVKRFSQDLLFHCPDMGILLTGTNDFIYKKATPHMAMKNIAWMVKKMEENQITPILLTPLLVNVEMASAFWQVGIGVDYEEVNGLLIELGELMLAAYPEYTLDLQGLFLEATGTMKKEDITVDGLHPTALSHEIIAEMIIREKIA